MGTPPMHLGLALFLSGCILAQEPDALAALRLKAEHGSAREQCLLAWNHIKGTGGAQQDFEEGRKWLWKAAQQHFPEGEYLYWFACGDKESKEDLKWLQQAAEHGLPEAQYELGGLLSRGEGMSADVQESARWLLQAARQKFGPAQFQMAYLHSVGEGVELDWTEAYAWCLLADKQGCSRSPMTPAEFEQELTPDLKQKGQIRAAALEQSFKSPMETCILKR